MVEGDLILGRFRVAERLGEGGFGTVHAAWDERLERAVAVKEIPGGDGQRVLREAQAAARLNHAGIVTLYELGRERGRAYLVSELVQGSTLRELAAAGELTDRDAAAIGGQLCEALAHAHAHGVVHRDIKPENVVVADQRRVLGRRDRQAKLMDFGIAHLAGAPTLTATGQVVGTIAYMAPEQAEGEEVGPEADVYSLALTLYEAWAGRHPIRRANAAATARAIGEPVASLAGTRRDLPLELTETIDACLDPDPACRPELPELREELASAADELDPNAPVPHPERADDASPRAPARALALAPLAGLVATLVALVALGRPGGALVLALLGVPTVLALATPRSWLLPLAAPILALIGLASVYPVVAALPARSPAARIVVGALGAAWAALAASMLGWRAPLAGIEPAPRDWTSSLGGAVDLLGSALSVEAIGVALLWGLAAALFGAVVDLRNPAARAILALGWGAGLLAAERLLVGSGSDLVAPPAPVVLAIAALLAAIAAGRDASGSDPSRLPRPRPTAPRHAPPCGLGGGVPGPSGERLGALGSAASAPAERRGPGPGTRVERRGAAAPLP